jgi:hypothetical protein
VTPLIEIAPGRRRPIAIVDVSASPSPGPPGAARRQGAEGGSGQTNGENSGARPPINVDRVGLLLRRAPPFRLRARREGARNCALRLYGPTFQRTGGFCDGGSARAIETIVEVPLSPPRAFHNGIRRRNSKEKNSSRLASAVPIPQVPPRLSSVRGRLLAHRRPVPAFWK